MKQRQRRRLSPGQLQYLKGLYAKFYADSYEYCEEHLNFLRKRRDAYLQSLKA